MTPSVRRIVAPLVGILAFGLFWEGLVRVFDIRRFVLLAPSAVIRQLAEFPSFYWDNAMVTARHMFIGLTISLVLAIVAGSLMAASRFIEEAAQPVLVLILVTPWVAYITSVVIWLNYGERPILFLVAFTTFPVFTFGVVGGMRSADPSARELLRSVDARPWEVLWRLRLPSALPSIFNSGSAKSGCSQPHGYLAASTRSPSPMTI